jgi:hypothetical protein
MTPACLDEELLAGYLEGDLSEDERNQVEVHLAGCESCLQEFVLTRNMVQGIDDRELDPVPEKVTASAVKQVRTEKRQPFLPFKKIIKESTRDIYNKVSDILTQASGRELDFATVRSGSVRTSPYGIIIRKTFARIQTEIEIEKATQDIAHIKVRFPGNDRQSIGTRITLQKGDREVASFLYDKSGYVLFEDVPFGHYSLVFRRDGDVFGTYLFELKETNHGRR